MRILKNDAIRSRRKDSPWVWKLPRGFTGNIKDLARETIYHYIGKPSPHLDDYPSLEQVEATMHKFADENPDRVELKQIGTSTEGRDILALRISDNIKAEQTKDKPDVLVVSNQHSSEWPTNQVTTAAIQKLLDHEEQCLKDLEIWFVPMVNPDGYERARSQPKFWRKNARQGADGEVAGVDLNRNYPYNYRHPSDTADSTKDDIGGSDDPSHLNYRGPHALSEPESQALNQLIEDPETLGVLDVHSFGRIIYTGTGEHGVSSEEYKEISEAMQSSIGEVEYYVDALDEDYDATGLMSPYVDSLGKVGVTLEVGTSYQPPPEERDRIVERASNGVVEFVRQMRERA